MSDAKHNRKETSDDTEKTAVVVCPVCSHWHIGSPTVCENCGAALPGTNSPKTSQKSAAPIEDAPPANVAPRPQPVEKKKKIAESNTRPKDLSSEFEISLPIEKPDYSDDRPNIDVDAPPEAEEPPGRSLSNLMEEIPDVRQHPELADDGGEVSVASGAHTVQDVPLPADSMLSLPVPHVVRVSAMKQWRELLRDWNNDRRHKAFVQTLVSQGGVELAAIAYKNYLQLHPKDEQAIKWKDKLALQAVLMVAPEYLGQSQKTKHIEFTPFVIIMMVAAIGGLTALLTYIMLLFPDWLK